jgi:hypothetical protein
VSNSVDEHERASLIRRLGEYSGAPIPVPGSDAVKVELPRPSLERVLDDPGAARLRFELSGVPAFWADVFNGEAGGRSWPRGLPIPRIENDCIDVARLSVSDVRRYVEALRDYVADTNREAERQRPEIEAREQESEAAVHRFEEEFEEAQRFLNEQFGPSRD